MNKRVLSYSFILLIPFACKEKYDLPFTGPSKGFLVVEGFINSGAGPTNIRLSRTLALVDTLPKRNEINAVVSVESKDNSKQLLTEKGQGLYSTDQLTIQSAQQYRLHIKTKEGTDYYSDYMSAITTPPIDSLSWEWPSKGVEIFVNTHDPQNNTRYYRWEYEETWEFHSLHYSLLQYKYDSRGNPYAVEARPPESAQKLFYCWKSENSTSILTGTSVRLNRDSIHLPLTIIPNADWRLSVLYSILVKQYAVSAEQYEFLRRMKKNTEQVGSLFDAQPSQLNSNIHNINNPGELVVGFIGISDVQEKRLYIKNSEVPRWNYVQYCDEIIAGYRQEQLMIYKYDIPLAIHELSQRGDTISITVGPLTCTDCSYRGSNQKPSFWP